jgi:copper chaperone CopZ
MSTKTPLPVASSPEAAKPPGAGRHLALEVTGMTCASCLRRVERALEGVPGVAAATVNLAAASADVTIAQPVEPSALIDQLRRERGPVAMVGDGINDAPALAAADIGVAVATGTGAAMAAADITLVHGGVGALADAVTLARATRKIIRQNLGWAFGYNLLLVPLAAAGILPPVLAALAMAASSVTVVGNAPPAPLPPHQRSHQYTSRPDRATSAKLSLTHQHKIMCKDHRCDQAACPREAPDHGVRELVSAGQGRAQQPSPEPRAQVRILPGALNRAWSRTYADTPLVTDLHLRSEAVGLVPHSRPGGSYVLAADEFLAPREPRPRGSSCAQNAARPLTSVPTLRTDSSRHAPGESALGNAGPVQDSHIDLRSGAVRLSAHLA